MSHVNTILSCPDLQERLDRHFLGLDGHPRTGNMLTDVLMSPINTENVLQRQISPGNSKLRQVELTYKQRLLTAEISDSAVQDCTAGPMRGENSQVYNLDPDVGASDKWTVKPHDLQTNCIQNDMWFAEEIARSLDGLHRKMNIDMAQKLALNTGAFYGGSTAARDVATRATNIDPTYDPAEVIRYAFDELDKPGAPMVFGFGEIAKWFRRVEAACCANLGINVGDFLRQNTMGFFRDRDVQNAMTGEGFIAMLPGAAQILTFNEFSGPNSLTLIDEQSVKQGPIMDPLTGLVWDYYAELDCGVWKIQLKLAYDLAVLPDDLFHIGDQMNGVNYILPFDVDNT
jgi:hypothetical protein